MAGDVAVDTDGVPAPASSMDLTGRKWLDSKTRSKKWAATKKGHVQKKVRRPKGEGDIGRNSAGGVDNDEQYSL